MRMAKIARENGLEGLVNKNTTEGSRTNGGGRKGRRREKRGKKLGPKAWGRR